MYSESAFGNPGFLDGAISRFVQSLRHSAIGKSNGRLMKTGLPLVAMMLLAGPMIDYSRIFIAQQQLAHAIEATAMAFRHSQSNENTPGAPGVQSENRLKENILSHFQVNYPEIGADAAVKVDMTVADGKIKISATSRIPMLVMNYAGINFIQVGTSSEITNPVAGIR